MRILQADTMQLRNNLKHKFETLLKQSPYLHDCGGSHLF
mgnify:CR=1 FL=1